MKRTLSALLLVAALATPAISQEANPLETAEQTYTLSEFIAISKPLDGLNYEMQFDGKIIAITGPYGSATANNYASPPNYAADFDPTQNGTLRTTQWMNNVSPLCYAEKGSDTFQTMLQLKKGDTVTFFGTARASQQGSRKVFSFQDCQILTE